MSTAHTAPEMTRQEFELESLALAREFLALLHGRRISTGVVLQAAMELHRYTAKQLPLDAQGDLSIGMAAYAGELLQGIPGSSQFQTTH